MAIKVSRGDGAKKQTFNEINITPLTDIFLVLLIIMMVIAPSFQQVDNNIEIPEIQSGKGVDEVNATVSVTKDGEIYLNGEKTDKDSIEKGLAQLIKDNEAKEVIVKADKKAKSAEILDIMHAAQNAGYKKLIVAGEPLSSKEQKELKENSHRQKQDEAMEETDPMANVHAQAPANEMVERVDTMDRTEIIEE